MTPPGRASGRGDTGVYTDRRKRPLGAVSGHLCTLLHPRAVSGGTSASTAMVCRRRPLGGHLSLGWENGLCASTAAARLASSSRQQPTQTPDFGHIRTPATSSDVPGPSRGPSLRTPSQATPDRSSQHKREAHPEQRLGGPGLPIAPARARPRRLNQGQQVGPRHHGARLVEEAGPPCAPGPTLPPGPCETRLLAQRPSIPTVPSWRRDGPPTAGMLHPPMFYARPGAE